MTLDLTPFGFTPTESLVYATLLRLGPSTGYAIARSARLARANAYGALEGLVSRGAATRTPPPARPARYRPIDPQALIAQLATIQGEALDRLGRELRGLSRPGEPVTREVAGSRAVANLVMQLVARAERRVEGVVALELWRPTLPAWRRAGERAQMDVRVRGDVPQEAPSWLKPARDDAPSATILVMDESQLVVTSGDGEGIAGLWTSHPLIVMLARRALQTALLSLALLVGACRARPIPEAERYPAGTPFRAQYRIVDGTRLRMIDSGNGGGTPVVLIHGIGASMYGWRYAVPAIVAAGYRVVAFDNRGFGFSEKPAHGYHNADYVRLVVALLDSLGISSAVLVGHSMGGAIAAEVALTHPDRVRGLVLIDAAGYGIRWPGVLKIARWPFIGAVATAFRGRWITGRILRSTFADPSRVTEAAVDQYYAPVPDANFGRALRGVLREFRFDSLGGGRLARVQTPTLILWGDTDRLMPLRDGARFARDLPRSEFVVIQRAGHDAQEESPDQVNRLLLDFLKAGLSRIPENVAWSTPPSRSSRSSSP